MEKTEHRIFHSMRAVDSRWARNPRGTLLEVVEPGRCAVLASALGGMAEAKSGLEKAPATKADLRRMNYTRRQLDEIARQLIRDGYFFYRHDFVWGFTPAFRNVRGTRFYFVAGGEIFTPRQMYTHLVKTWRPTAPDEQMFFQNRLTAHFAALPQEVPAWEGMDVSEMMAVEEFQPQGEMAGHQADAYAV